MRVCGCLCLCKVCISLCYMYGISVFMHVSVCMGTISVCTSVCVCIQYQCDIRGLTVSEVRLWSVGVVAELVRSRLSSSLKDWTSMGERGDGEERPL